jgi:hypothetical protein
MICWNTKHKFLHVVFKSQIIIRYQLLFSSPVVSYGNDVASIVVRWQGTFCSRQGYFNETWCDCEDTFGQYAQRFFDFRGLTYFVASRRPS